MLDLATQKCQSLKNYIKLIQVSATFLPIENMVIDQLFCQQGFQFFPDKVHAA